MGSCKGRGGVLRGLFLIACTSGVVIVSCTANPLTAKEKQMSADIYYEEWGATYGENGV